MHQNRTASAYSGKIRDPLHDTIQYTQAEKQIIDTPEFQRLRRILQTAFIRYVFPGATHTRFEHSIGVMHFSGVMLSSLIGNQKRLLESSKRALEKLSPFQQSAFQITEEHHGSLLQTEELIPVLESEQIMQTLRFAALLHDVGHSSFSHSGEKFMPTWQQFEAGFAQFDISDFLKIGIQKKLQKLKSSQKNYKELRVRHEIYTLLIVDKLFRNNQSSFVCPEMGQNICAVIDSSIDPAPNSLMATSGCRELLHEIVSGELDVDRMDYLLRDSREAGVVYGLFDAGRIFDSTGFYFDPILKEYHLAIRKSGVAALEDYLRARHSMYQQIYFHKTATACEAMLETAQKCFPSFTLPLNLNEYLKYDDHTFFSKLQSCSAQNINVTEQSKSNKTAFGESILENLLYNRKLWKRIYEENIPVTAASTAPSICPAILKYLKGLGIPATIIESATSLTRFSPKGRNQTSTNKLKVILKDSQGLRYLEPIENHSRLINQLDEEVLVRRIFIALQKEDGEQVNIEEIQSLVNQQVITPEID
jgi:uncharacterized protein